MPFQLPNIAKSIVSGARNLLGDAGILYSNDPVKKKKQEEDVAVMKYKNTPKDNLISPIGSEEEYGKRKEQQRIETIVKQEPKVTQLPKILGTTTELPPIAQTSPVGVGTTINGFVRQPSGSKHYDTIVNTSNEIGIDPSIVSAGLFNESGIDENAKDNNNYKDGKVVSTDRGIAQINNVMHPEVTDEQAKDPSFAIPWMARYMKENIDYFDGDLNRGIAAYNVGKGGASVVGPYAAGLGPRGQHYLNKFAKNLTPEQIQTLGLKVSSPEEELQIKKLLDEEAKKK